MDRKSNVLELIHNPEDPIEHRIETIIQYLQDCTDPESDDDWLRHEAEMAMITARLFYLAWLDGEY